MVTPTASRGCRLPCRSLLLSFAAVAAAAVAVFVATPTAAQTGAAFKRALPNTDLRVTASAQVKSPFNSVVIDLNIVTSRPTLFATITASRFAMATVRRQVLSASVPPRDIVIRDISLYPEYNYTQTGRVTIGWGVRQGVRITTNRVRKVQGLIRSIASTVGKNVQLDISSTREVDEVDDLILRSLREATLAARAKANRIAASTGKVVKRVIFLGGNKGGWPQMYASNGVYTVASQVEGKFLLTAPGEKVSGGDAEERLEDIVRAAEMDFDTPSEAQTELSGTTKGEDASLDGANPVDREYDTVIELGSVAEAVNWVV